MNATRRSLKGFQAVEAARRSIPSVRTVASEWVREFDRTGHGDDSDVQEFRRALATVPLREAS